MKFTKKKFLKSLMFGELLIVSLFYYYGQQGIATVFFMKTTNREAAKQLGVMQKELSQCEQELALWHAFSFYKEKIAREQLQMARSGETIFYLTHKPYEQYSNVSR